MCDWTEDYLQSLCTVWWALRTCDEDTRRSTPRLKSNHLATWITSHSQLEPTQHQHLNAKQSKYLVWTLETRHSIESKGLLCMSVVGIATTIVEQSLGYIGYIGTIIYIYIYI